MQDNGAGLPSMTTSPGGLVMLDATGKVPGCQIPEGAAGPPGPQGPAGPTGPQGPAGTAGATGSTGSQGPPGSDGAQGPQGIQGVPGDDGAAGAQGPQGDAGPQGIQGIQGIQGPAGTPGFMVGVKKDADQTGIGTSATDITGLGVTVANGQRIRFYCCLLVRTSATTIGGMVSVNGPAASLVSFKRTEWTSATVKAADTMATALDAFTAQTAGPGTTTVMYEIMGFVKFSAGGTFIPRIKAETGGTCSVLEGSWLEYNLA
jgi:hypothetical protein